MTFPPMVSPRFIYEEGNLKYKPFPAYPQWLVAWDLTFFMTGVGDAIAAETARAIEQETQLAAGNDFTRGIAEAAQSAADTALTAATIAESQANIGIADAAVAYGLAETASIDAGIAQTTADAAMAAANAITPKERRVTMFHHQSNVSGGTLTLNISSTAIDNHQAFSTAQGFNAYQSFACDLMPACKLYFIGVTNNASGIMAIYLDGAFINNLDWYSGAQSLNVIKTMSFVANQIGAGRHTLRLEVATKHASSSGYALTLTKYWLAPDVD